MLTIKNTLDCAGNINIPEITTVVLVAAGFSVLLYKTTMRKVLRMEEERRQKEEADLKSRGSNP